VKSVVLLLTTSMANAVARVTTYTITRGTGLKGTRPTRRRILKVMTLIVKVVRRCMTTGAVNLSARVNETVLVV
jgi:ribosomal protein L31E